jgi:hypothetical protein
MALRDVQLVLYTRDRVLNGQLMSTWEHVENILRYFLPRRSEQGGPHKLNLSLTTPEFSEIKDYWAALGVATLRVDDFDAPAYLRLSPSEQESLALEILRQGLVRYCSLREIDAEPMLQACAKVEATGYRLQIPLRKLCKSHSSRKLRAHILVTYRRGGTDINFRLTSRKGVLLDERRVLSDEWWPSAWFDNFRSYWEDDSYVVVSRTGEPTFEFACNEFLSE